MPNQTQIIPESIASNTKTITNRTRPNSIILFLGLLIGSGYFNLGYKKVDIVLPLDRLPLLKEMQKIFGGSVYIRYQKSAVITFTSVQSLRTIRKQVMRYQHLAPGTFNNLLAFLNYRLGLRHKGDVPELIRGVKGLAKESWLPSKKAKRTIDVEGDQPRGLSLDAVSEQVRDELPTVNAVSNA